MLPIYRHCYFVVLFIFLFGSLYSSKPDSSSLDVRIMQKMRDYHVPAALVSVVDRGEIEWAKAYGYENTDQQIPLDASRSLFRVASITKSFTAMAIMEMVDQGHLDLQEDIQAYLDPMDIQLESFETITLHHILSHSSGIEYSDFRISPEAMEDGLLKTLVRTSIPKQVFTPGEVYSYSNAAYAILGLLIEEVSGQRYESYMDAFVRRNFGMKHSTFYQDIPEHPLDHAVSCYKFENDRFIQLQRQFLRNPSASTLNTTAMDMARFMQCLIIGKRFNSDAALPFDISAMWEPQYRLASDKEAMGYGFFMDRIKGKKVIHHGGGIRGFISDYRIFPQDSFGIFVVQNIRYGAGNFVYELQDEWIDSLIVSNEYAPSFEPKEPIDQWKNRYDGLYQLHNINQSRFEKARRLFGLTERRVEVLDNYDIRINKAVYKPIQEHNFLVKRSDKDWQSGFVVSDEDKAIYLHQGLFGIYKRIPWYQSYRALQVLIVSGFLVLVLHLLISFFNQRHQTARSNLRLTERWSSLFLLGGFAWMIVLYAMDVGIDRGTPFSFILGLIMINIGAIIVLIQWIFLFRNWSRLAHWKNRSWHLLWSVSSMVILAIFYHLNVLGFHYY